MGQIMVLWRGGDITQVLSAVAGVNVQPCISVDPEHSGHSVAFRRQWELKRKQQPLFGFRLQDEALS